jgi:hypothetical protein
MDVACWQKLLPACRDPPFPSGGLTLRAMPVSAGVVRDRGTMPTASALIQMPAQCGGANMLYVSRRHWDYVNQLRESIGNRKIKREQMVQLVVGVLCLIYAAWNFWLFARGNKSNSQPVQTAKTPNPIRDIAIGISVFLGYFYIFWQTFKSKPRNRVIQCGSITLMLFFVLMALMSIPNLPFDYFWWLWPALFSLCMVMMFFLFQQGYRALRNRKNHERS